MTQDSNTTANDTSLQAWWDEIAFPEKDAFKLTENGELILKSDGIVPERTVGTLTTTNAAAVLKALTDKFPEVEAKVKELETEWNSAEDKLKLVGKVERMKEYLLHTNAVGNFRALHAVVAEMDKQMHKLADSNYDERLKLVQQAEELAAADNWKETTQQFRDLTEQWKNIGYTDKHKSDELWNRLEAAKTKFFDRKRENQEEQNKEMLQNLDLKMEIVEKAELLAASEEWKKSTEIFKALLEEWKKTGRVVAGKNEELWNRFITAKNSFFDRKKVHYDKLTVEQEANYAAKTVLTEKAESLQESTEWGPTTQAMTTLMDDWKKIGRVPQEKGDELWDRFNKAREQFFQAKRQHFETRKVGHEDNLAQKLALIKRAESLQHSNQWRESTIEMNELMDEWKKIGPVPRDQSEPIWERFLAARKKFYERKDSNREQRKQRAEHQVTSRLKQSNDFIRTLEAELKEEEDKLADFKNGIENITPGRKAKELKAHLEKLIQQTEQNITAKQKKLESVRKQMEEMNAKDSKESATATNENAGDETTVEGIA